MQHLQAGTKVAATMEYDEWTILLGEAPLRPAVIVARAKEGEYCQRTVLHMLRRNCEPFPKALYFEV